MNRTFGGMARWLLLPCIAVLLASACSSDSILEPNHREPGATQGGSPGDHASLAEQIQIEGRVATVEEPTQTLTLVEVAESVVAAEDCEILKTVAGVETILEFADIQVGDSVRVCGTLEEEGFILAQRIRIFCEGDCADSILAFRDSIAVIDYSLNTFTVFGRTETIIVDTATVIWVNLGKHGQALGLGDEPGGDPGKGKMQWRTILNFTDLFVGAEVEVKATVIDPTALYAVSIKLAPSSLKECVNFEAVLASVAVDTRIVTFDGLAWIGAVCQNAQLTGSAGETLTLGDFAAGELVSVKGFPAESDTLQVCRMAKL